MTIISKKYVFALAAFPLLLMVGFFAHVAQALPQDPFSVQTAAGDSRICSGSHCTLVATYLDWATSPGNFAAAGPFGGLAGLHVAMSMDTQLLSFGMAAGDDTLQPFTPGETFTIPVDASGEIVGHAVGFYDTPPITFQPNGIVLAETDGLTLCASRPVIFGVPMSCGSSIRLRGTGDIRGNWSDTWRVFTDDGSDTFQVPSSITCSSNSAGTLGTCSGSTEEIVRVELTRSVSNMRWMVNSARLPLSGNRIFPARMVSNAYVNFGPAPECSDDIDNDADNAIDAADPGCHTDGDPNNPDSYDPNHDDEEDIPAVDLKVTDPDGVTSDGPVTVQSGEDVVLTWTSANNIASCSASGGWTGSRIPENLAGEIVVPPSTVAYTLNCVTAAGAPAQDSVIVNVTSGPTPTPSAVFVPGGVRETD